MSYDEIYWKIFEKFGSVDAYLGYKEFRKE